MIHLPNWTGRRVRRKKRDLERNEVLPRQTQSLCPQCLAAINAVLYEEDGRVLMKEHCSLHGTFTELISSDATFYRLQVQRDRSILRPVRHPLVGETRACPQGCGLCTEHRSGPLLLNIDLTNRATPIPAFVDVEPLMEMMQSAARQLQRGGLFSRVGVSYTLRKLRRFYHEETAPAGWSFDLFVDFLTDFADFRKRYRTNQDRMQATRQARHRPILMASMHFQDVYNYQLDRVRRCVVQYAAPDGRLYPFCTYNSGPCHRQRVEDQFAVPLDQSASAGAGGAS